jgi:hypothetical protein
MKDDSEKLRRQALESISELLGGADFEFYMDIAFDAIGNKLAKNGLFKDLGIDSEAADISDVLEALVQAKIIGEEAAQLPNEFNDAIGDLYPFGNTPLERPGEILSKMHDLLKTAIDRLAEKHAKTKPQR